MGISKIDGPAHQQGQMPTAEQLFARIGMLVVKEDMMQARHNAIVEEIQKMATQLAAANAKCAALEEENKRLQSELDALQPRLP